MSESKIPSSKIESLHAPAPQEDIADMIAVRICTEVEARGGDPATIELTFMSVEYGPNDALQVEVLAYETECVLAQLKKG